MATEVVVIEEAAKNLGEISGEIAKNLDDVSKVAQQIRAPVKRIFFGGLGSGLLVGFFFGYRFNREQIKAEAFKKSEEEVALIREQYRRYSDIKREGTVNTPPKPPVEEIIKSRGYASESTREDVEKEKDNQERLLRPPVPVRDPDDPPHVIESARMTSAGPSTSRWNPALEQSRRKPGQPHIIHEDEYRQGEFSYAQVAYTYYDGDDIITDEDDTPLTNPDGVVGLNNLRFGHGTDSEDTVFVRNDSLELDMEITRLHKSYEQEIVGLEGNDTP